MGVNSDNPCPVCGNFRTTYIGGDDHKCGVCGNVFNTKKWEWEHPKDFGKILEKYHACKDMHRERGEIIAKLEQKYEKVICTHANMQAMIDERDYKIIDLEADVKRLMSDLGDATEDRMKRAGHETELKTQRDKLHESNNRQSDIIYDLKVQRDELMYFAEWVLAEADRQRNGEGGDLRTMKHTAEELLIRIKGDEEL